jgi:hypothetical protein
MHIIIISLLEQRCKQIISSRDEISTKYKEMNKKGWNSKPSTQDLKEETLPENLVKLRIEWYRRVSCRDENWTAFMD